MMWKYLAIIFVVAVGIVLIGYSRKMNQLFRRESITGLKRTVGLMRETVTEADLDHLPSSVRNYLHYVGVVGKEKVYNMRVDLEGRIRSNPDNGWMTASSTQYSFFDDPARIFYIKASKFGIPAFGLHLYKNEKASFVVKILGLIKVVDARGDKLDQAETVTLFNDMCLLAPATLISDRIQWEEQDSLTVRAKYTNGGITISALLVFNPKGELINFISHDRFETDGKQYHNYPWLTPVKKYGKMNGYTLCSEVSTDYQRPDTSFSYGEFRIKEIKYNCRDWE